MKKTLSFLGACLLAGATVIPAAEATEFKPGNRGFGVEVPAGTTMAGTNEEHPCAGRKLAYHSHVDAIYATRLDGELQTMIVDGQVPIPADELCLRLAPDANKDGEEVSRLVVPEDDPNLSFLGEPGTILWVAPQEVDFMDSWRPLWAGAGAFDPHHELEVPTDFADGKVTMELAEVDGPGDVEMFFYNRSVDQPDRVFSTKKGKNSFQLNVGSHGHYSWTFSQAGIYHLSWRVHGKKTDGSEETGPLVTTTWLVGSDEEVGLPAGTTTELTPITKSAEDIRDEMKPTTTPTAPGEIEEYTQSTEQVQELLWRSNPSAMITHGHQDMGLFGAGQEASAMMRSDVDGDHRSTTFVYAVPNRTLTQIPAKARTDIGVCAGWLLPQAQDPTLPWQGFSTENFDYSSVSPEGITVSISNFEGPGRMIATHDSLTKTTISLDSDDPDLKVHYPQRSHDHMAFVFTQPGAYRVTYAFEGTLTDGKPLYTELVAYYMVGDSALYDAATTMGIDPASLQLSEPTTRDTTPKCEPVTESPTPIPAPTVAPTPTPVSDSPKNDIQDLGLALGLGSAALTIGSRLLNRDTAPAPSAPAAPAKASAPKPEAAPEPAPATNAGERPAPKAAEQSAPKSGAKSTSKAPKSASKAGAKTTAKPTPTSKPPLMPAQPASAVAAAPTQSPTVTNAASQGGLTAGGWMAGFVVGIGLMSLLGGLGLFIATARALRRFGGQEELE